MEKLPIHANADDNSEIVRFARIEDFPPKVQDLANNGDVWGAYIDERGKVVVQDRWNDLHETEVRA